MFKTKLLICIFSAVCSTAPLGQHDNKQSIYYYTNHIDVITRCYYKIFKEYSLKCFGLNYNENQYMYLTNPPPPPTFFTLYVRL